MKTGTLLSCIVAAMSWSIARTLAGEHQPPVSQVEQQLLTIELNIALEQYKKLGTQLSEMRFQEGFPQANSRSKKEEKLRQNQEQYLVQNLDTLKSQIRETGKKLEAITKAMELARSQDASPLTKPERDNIPDRDPQATPKQIDLSRFYNASLRVPWHRGTPGNDLSALPTGLQELDGTRFDVRGAVQLSGPLLAEANKSYPHQVSGIPVRLKAERLHLLHGAVFSEADGVVIGQYVIHYANGEKEIFPITYGETVRDWWYYPGSPKEATQSRIAWTGNNEAATSWNPSGQPPVTLRLYQTPWTNPHPDVEITAVDLVSEEKTAVPFLIAITAE